MAWTAPRTWVTSEVVTAALLNAHVRDNLLETAPAKVTTAGDIVYATAANALARLAIGTTSQFLRGGSSAPSWTNTLIGAVTASTLFNTQVTGDTQNRVEIQAGGNFLWGSGSAAGDTNLYRSAADTLRTDDSLIIMGSQYINDTSNANMTTGLTINQGAADDEILALKSSDVAHGVTDFAETDTYGLLSKVDAAAGGVRLRGFSEDVYAVQLSGIATGANTARSTIARAPVEVDAMIKSGTGKTAPGTNGNLLMVAGNGSARFLVDDEGDVHYDGTTNAGAWDEHDDVALLEAFRVVTAPGVVTSYRQRFSSDVERHAAVLAETGVITLNDDGHHFVSSKGLNGLLIDAIRQLAGQIREQAALIADMRRMLPAPGGA